MEYGLTNITSATTTVLKDFDEYGGGLKSIQISNNNASNEVTVGLFLNDGTTANNAYFFKNLVIPVGASLLLTEGINFDTSILSLQLITAGTSPDVSVIIK